MASATTYEFNKEYASFLKASRFPFSSFSLHSVCVNGTVHHYSRMELIKGD